MHERRTITEALEFPSLSISIVPTNRAAAFRTQLSNKVDDMASQSLSYTSALFPPTDEPSCTIRFVSRVRAMPPTL